MVNVVIRSLDKKKSEIEILCFLAIFTSFWILDEINKMAKFHQISFQEGKFQISFENNIYFISRLHRNTCELYFPCLLKAFEIYIIQFTFRVLNLE